MTETEIRFILADKGVASKIGHDSTKTDGGAEHPLWTLLNNRFPPSRPWKTLRGKERTQICLAGEKLHATGVPYSFYVDFLDRTGKGYLKHLGPFMVTKYHATTTGRQSLLGEYLMLVSNALEIYKRKPEAVTMNDAVYKAFPLGYLHGALRYIYGLGLIDKALENHSYRELLATVGRCRDIDEFWNSLGGSVLDNAPVEVDLSKGVRSEAAVKLLQKEMRIRLGKDEGRPTPAFDKYFKHNNTLNAQGLKIVSGEKAL